MSNSNPLLRRVLIASSLIPPIAIFASIPLLKQLPDAVVLLLTGVAAAMTVIASFVLSILHDQKLDEWNRSNARFSSQWGWTAGASLVALLLAIPAFRSWIVSLVEHFNVVASPDNASLILMTFTFGFMAVVMAQLICTAILSFAWIYWKSRPARDPS